MALQGSNFPRLVLRHFLVQLALLSTVRSYHFKELYPNTIIKRVAVKSDFRSWKKNFTAYAPISYSNECAIGECDPDIGTENFHPKFNELDGTIDRRRMPKVKNGKKKLYMIENGLPLNPRGRTGLAGRGELKRWGPNHLVYVMLSRGEKPREYAVMQTNHENELPDYPHVFVDNPRESDIPAPILEMLKANLGAIYSPKYVERMIKDIEKNNVEFYRGYLTDQRNTDNAWIEMRLIEINDPTYKHIGLIDFTPANNPFNLTWTIFDRTFFHEQISKRMAQSDTKFSSKFARRLRAQLLEIKVGTAGYRFMLFRMGLVITSTVIGAATLG
uniref:ADP-ribose pyrophosphatase, mitochondrial n=1 Tax=Trichuris muris TaxID=70415 RepID=A0A5S6Q100_TRIMR